MLIRFWVRNYRRFGDRVELDFTDKKNYRFGKECVRGDLLEKVVIIGNNGAGKTSFGYALVDIVSTLTDLGNDVGQDDPDCFINGSDGTDRAVFHYEISHRGEVIAYEYAKTSPSRIVAESLSVGRGLVYRYDLEDPSASEFRLGVIGCDPVPDVRPDGSEALLRTIGRTVRLSGLSPARAVLDFARSAVYYMAMWKMDVHIGYMGEEDDVERYILDNGLLDELRGFLNDDCRVDIDVGVTDRRMVVRTGVKEIPFFRAVSRGTAILCRLYCWNRRSSEKDALIFFDDFDDLFDHRTAEVVMTRIIRNSRAQCVFVTHNVGIISSDSLRPDCCFILQDGRLRSLASLTDKSIRRGHNLEKMLRDGEFDRGMSERRRSP